MKRSLLWLGCLLGTALFLPPRVFAQQTVTVAAAPAPGRRASKPGQAVRAAAPAVAQQPTLRWNNGESITGDCTEATAANLTWKTPFFEDPLLLGWPELHRIDWPRTERPPDGAFSFILRDGSHLYGDLISLTPDELTIHSAVHGDAVLLRSAILSAWRNKGGPLIYSGPQGEFGWKPAAGISFGHENTDAPAVLKNVPTRLTGPGGALVLPFTRRSFFLDVPLPESMDVEFHLHSKGRPAFQFALNNAAKERLRIETWGDQLVLTAANAFTEIRQIGAQERNIALRVCWDRQTHHCKVYTPAGALLTDWAVPDDQEAEPPGILLENKGAELALDFLRIRNWSGSPPAAADLARPGVELGDGQVVAGKAECLEAGTLVVAATGEGPPARFALDQVDALVFDAGPPAADLHQTTLTFTDGTYLLGQVAGLEDGAVTLNTPAAHASLTAKTGALRQMLIRAAPAAAAPPGPPPDTLDKIAVGDTTLHGRYVATDAAMPGWLAIGAERPVRPSNAYACEITRYLPPATGSPATTTLLFTRMGDVLPGALHALDRTELAFDSPLIEARTLPAEEYKAIQFNVAEDANIRGFDAPGWRWLKGGSKTQETGGVLNLPPNASVAHPSAMQNGEVSFTYDSTTFSCVRLRMFCDGTEPGKGISYMLMRMGNSMSITPDAGENGFSPQNQMAVPNGPVAVRIAVSDKGIRCYFNGFLEESVLVPLAKRAGSGLIIEPASLWGNQVVGVTLSNFLELAAPGQSAVTYVNADAKAQALTVPRFRKEDPPRHVLVAANGDLLRGEVEGLTKTHFGFRIGLDTLQVPIQRVCALITLGKPDAGSPPPADEDPVRKLLDRSMDQQNWYANFDQLIKQVEQRVPELKFKLPPPGDTRTIQYQFGARTVGDTLDDLCAKFDLRCRVDQGVVVIEASAPVAEPGMVRKTYWLKSDALAGSAPIKRVLAGKGIDFPDGSSVALGDDPRLIEMTNTAAAQEKLAAILANDFGGVSGSPNYWLLLANGGRLGLAVDKFGADIITGTHPIYGRCTVPASDVYAIRNAAPAATAAGRAMNDWRLVYAPEPVLPESGGEGSALLNKDAPAFKVPMLDGGDFDLAKEKGHVVVLDFWATWCGPCISSLPGMIEAMAQFPADRVKFIALDQAEAPDQVKRFLETHGWKLSVAMDAGQNVARQYGVDGIPHTVIIGPDGKVAWVNTGFTPDGDEKAAEAVKKLLAPAPGTTSASLSGPSAVSLR